MVKKLVPIGNSLGLIIDGPVLDLLDIDRDTPLEVKTDGESLIIRPIREERGARVLQSAERMMDIHEETLQNLAK